MLLLKTLILPTDDSELASSLLRDFLTNSKYILFIVLGDDSKARETVELADKRSGKIEEPQWVVWVRNPKTLTAVLETLKLSDANLLKDWSKVLAVCVNPKSTICFVCENLKVPDRVVVLEAFTTCKSTANFDKVGSITVPAFPADRTLNLSGNQDLPPVTDNKEKPPANKKKTDKPKLPDQD
ncbi:MAG: hypothetical protein IPM47_05520 [Sphingobacteriales bacterium]|nr:MAG: hypothetical protein IPM47_05520 [Sphingobacteriales bacterium]